MKAFVHLSRFDARSSFATWLTRIGINSALQLLRKRKKGLEIPVERSLDGGDTWEDWDIPDTSLDPEARYMAFEQSVRLPKAIRGLPHGASLRCQDTTFRELFDAGTCRHSRHFRPCCKIPASAGAGSIGQGARLGDTEVLKGVESQNHGSNGVKDESLRFGIICCSCR